MITVFCWLISLVWSTSWAFNFSLFTIRSFFIFSHSWDQACVCSPSWKRAVAPEGDLRHQGQRRQEWIQVSVCPCGGPGCSPPSLLKCLPSSSGSSIWQRHFHRDGSASPCNWINQFCLSCKSMGVCVCVAYCFYFSGWILVIQNLDVGSRDHCFKNNINDCILVCWSEWTPKYSVVGKKAQVTSLNRKRGWSTVYKRKFWP